MSVDLPLRRVLLGYRPDKGKNFQRYSWALANA